MNIVAKFKRISWQKYFDFYNEDFLPDAETVKKLKQQYDGINLPERSTKGSAGYDIYSPINLLVDAGDSVVVPTGIRVEIENGWAGFIFPRSGLGFKYQVGLANTVGLIDSDYFYADNEGHILVKLVNRGTETVAINAGDKFCQMVLLPFGLADGDSVTESRVGGFGSTGN